MVLQSLLFLTIKMMCDIRPRSLASKDVEYLFKVEPKSVNGRAQDQAVYQSFATARLHELRHFKPAQCTLVFDVDENALNNIDYGSPFSD